MAPQEKKWDDAAERDLCISMIYCNTETGKVRQNWPRIEEVMKGLGYSFTKDAMSQHYSKTIMKDFKIRHPSLTVTNLTETASPASARKTKAAAAAGKGDAASTPSKKRTKKSPVAAPKDEEDDDDELDATPSKKVKKEEKASPVKKEETTDEAAAETTADKEDKAFQDWAAKGPSDEE